MFQMVACRNSIRKSGKLRMVDTVHRPFLIEIDNLDQEPAPWFAFPATIEGPGDNELDASSSDKTLQMASCRGMANNS